jgi:serine/threonine-protein kinase
LANPHLIGATFSRPTDPARSTTRSGSLWRPSRPLPPDLLRDASRRLGIMALLGAVLWIVAPVAGHLAYHAMRPDDPRWSHFRVPEAVCVVASIVSVLLFVFTRLHHADPKVVLDVGLVYLVVTAAALGVTAYWEAEPPPLIMPIISWAGPLVLMFAAIVPSTPLKTAVASFISVSMLPAFMLLARARGVWDFGPTRNVLVMHYTDYLLAGVAVAISHVMTRLGQQVAKARELGSYQLGELLGRGGMGEVYRASHRLLARPAAIKLIRADTIAAGDSAAAQLAVRRFRREAEAAARLTSPHTVALYDFGVTDDQTLFLVMELLEGKDLQTLVREHGPMPAARVVHVIRQVCYSLDEAHAAGLIHRDIKPANVHLGRVGTRYDFVKVLDFGLVKSVGGVGGLDESLGTAAAALTPGTPAYLPPEAALGGPIDARSDLYSLGCVAYFLLTGRLVFEADTALQVIAKHLRSEPLPPSRFAPFPAPAALDRVVLACLAKKPEDRPRTAPELVRLLSAVEVEPWTQADAMEWWWTVDGMPARELDLVSQRPAG